MTRLLDKHLDDDELDRLVLSEARSVADSARPLEEIPEDTRRHVQSCPDCHRKVQMHKFVQSEISRLVMSGQAPSGPDCIGSTEWMKVAAGLRPELKTRELMNHAAQCGHCGPLLRNAAETLSDDATADEEGLLAGLQPELQRDVAENLRGRGQSRQLNLQRPPRWQGLLSSPRPVLAAAAFAVVIVAAWLGLRLLRTPSVEQLLAQAYTEHRTMEMRIPRAQYAPMRMERSTTGSNLDRPPSLLKAEAIIGENLRQHPNDPAWLQAKARVDLLDGNYESAIESLQRALETQPDSPGLLTDLASAYVQRADSSDRAIDYGNAVEALGRALTKSPNDPVALFNRAIVSERMFLYTQAVGDWQHYLRVDSTGPWADDARKRLDALRQKLEKHNQSSNEPLLGPKQFAEAISGGDEATKSAIDQRVEDYLYQALAHWLSTAYPPSSQTAPSQERRDTRDALVALAKILADHHHDLWLADFLAFPVASGPAVGALSKAVVANKSVNPGEAQRNAAQAVHMFRASANTAGVMRAQFEEIYALHWLQESSLCAAKTLQLIPELSEHRYVWLLTQVQLERFVCTNAMEHSQEAELALKSALPTVLQAGYGTLYLRGVGFSAFLQTENGNRRAAWSLNHLGLAKYWSGVYPAVRANQFYSDLCSDAEEQANWQLALPLAREALKFAVDDGDTSFEAISRYRLANDALMAGSTNEGLSQFQHAHQLFNSLPQDSTTKLYRAYSELFSAKRELRNGDLDKLRGTMTAIGALLPGISNDLIAMDFYHTWGELERRQGNISAAQWALTTAILIAEKRRQSLANERQRLTWNHEAGDIYRSLVETKLEPTGDAEGALELWEWYRSAGLRAQRDATMTTSGGWDARTNLGSNLLANPVLPAMDTVRRSLPSLSSKTVVSYAQLPHSLAIWIYDDRGVTVKLVPISKQNLASLAEHFRELCSDPNSNGSALRDAARHLHDLLISPIQQQLAPGRALVLELDGALGEIPFRALLDSSGRYVADVYSIEISPGLMYQQPLTRSSVIEAHDRALVVGSPRYELDENTAAAPLPDASLEANAIAARFQEVTLLIGKEATLNAVQKNLPKSNIFHFAGHAYATVDGPLLLLAGSTLHERGGRAFLSADHLGAMRLRQCKLVVLSACETGQSRDVGLADPESLVRTFLGVGVGNVVASRWKVESAATGAFMNSFYSALLSGQRVSVALETAALNIRRKPGMAHPYYWAAFESYGRM